MSIIEHLIAVIAPHECLGCRTEGTLLCPPCAAQLPISVPQCYRCGSVTKGATTCRSCRRSTDISALYVATEYQGVAKQLIYGLKFNRQKAGAAVLARALADCIGDSSDCTYVVVPVPTAYSRVRMRGYDQAELIAQEVARICNMSIRLPLLRLGAERQVGQSRVIRKQQLAQAFATKRTAGIQNRHILLIDDVITTGATLEAAARALKMAGAARVSAAVFAKA